MLLLSKCRLIRMSLDFYNRQRTIFAEHLQKGWIRRNKWQLILEFEGMEEMDEQLNEILNDLEILLEDSGVDYKEGIYHSYQRYVTEYNTILQKLQSIGMFTNISVIQAVPSYEKSGYGIGTSAEISKHREVIGETKKLIHRVKANLQSDERKEPIKILEELLSKFHTVARQLRSRYSNRSTLDINDEYDVQDLLHALLKIYFDDVRPEEWTPSYAGGSKRMDFLLKNEKVVIEVKKTRNGLSDKAVGEQLLVDIEAYKEHTDCQKLFCFVYDPEGKIGNPIGLENDLAKQSRGDLEVVARIYPK